MTAARPRVRFARPHYAPGLQWSAYQPPLPDWEIVVGDPTAPGALDGVDVLVAAAVEAELIGAGGFGLIQQIGTGTDRIDVANRNGNDMSDDHRVQHDLDVLRDEHARERLALRRLERIAEAEERALERRLRELDERHRRSADRLETEYRRAHYGKPSHSWPPHGEPER